MPFFSENLPVAAATHTGSDCVGRTVARSITAPRSSMRARLPSCPVATRWRMNPSDAPSSRTTVTAGTNGADAGATQRLGGRTGVSPGPRSQSGPATDSTINSTIDTPATRRPRRQNE